MIFKGIGRSLEIGDVFFASTGHIHILFRNESAVHNYKQRWLGEFIGLFQKRLVDVFVDMDDDIVLENWLGHEFKLLSEAERFEYHTKRLLV